MTKKNAKIAFIYDVCNNLYLIAKGLRQLGYDITLYVVDGSSINTLPESEDKSLSGNYPDWIKFAPEVRIRNLVGIAKYELIDELNTYDLVVGSREFTLLANILKTKKVFCVSGSDLFVQPFYFSKPAMIDLKRSNYRKFLSKAVKAFFCRRGIRNCDMVISDEVDVYRDFYLKLFSDTKRLRMTPSYVILDMERFQRKSAVDLSGINFSIPPTANLKVFMPSRLLFDEVLSDPSTGQWKANDVLIKSFEILKKRGHSSSSFQLLLIDTHTSRDVGLAKELIKNLGISDYVVWISKQGREPLTKEEILAIYSIVDVVSDDFGLGWMGSIAIEACATKNVLVTYAKHSIPKYGGVPFFSTNDPTEVAVYLERLGENAILREDVSRKSHAWVGQYHGFEALSNSYELYFNEVLSR